MGACVSMPERCLTGRQKHLTWLRRRRRKASNRLASANKLKDDIHGSSNGLQSNECLEEIWFDTNVIVETDLDEDFQSIQNDAWSFSGSMSSLSSFKESRHVNIDAKDPEVSSANQQQQDGAKLEEPMGNKEDIMDTRPDRFLTHEDFDLSLDESAFQRETSGTGDHCVIIMPNNSLTCPDPMAPNITGRRSLSFSPPKARTKAPKRLSF